MLRIVGSGKETRTICEVTWTCGCGARPDANLNPNDVVMDGIGHSELTGHAVEFRGYARRPWHASVTPSNSGRRARAT